MLAGLQEQYKPMLMGKESSGVIISADSIKTKLLQEVRKESDTTVLHTMHRYPQKKSPQNNQIKPRGPRCYNCYTQTHPSKNCFANKKESSNTNAVFSACTTMDSCDWILDSGAFMHMTRRSDWLYDTSDTKYNGGQ